MYSASPTPNATIMHKSVKEIIHKLEKWYFSREALPFWAVSIIDLSIIFTSMVIMYCLVYGPAELVRNGSNMLYTFIIDMIFYCVGMRVFHTYADVSRVLEFKDLSRTSFAVLLGSGLCLALRWAVNLLPFTEDVPYRVFVLTAVCAIVLLTSWRVVARSIFDMVRHNVREEVELLPRSEIQVNMAKIGELISGKCVLITGAAGSIGSEMARQIASYTPRALVLIDQAETPMHDLKLEMKNDWEFIPTEYLVTTITNEGRMRQVFEKYRPDYVFHAAAYKHVPMMEADPSSAILNNVLGTRIMADLAVEYKVKKFVMISTDKAVNPTNVMGCSKRICEMYVQSLNAYQLQQKDKAEHTQFVTTRFGNVLGSNGSVIPLFKKQIELGGPVTVAHPDIIRYFMLIPEACALVLEAGTMGKGGEVFVFDMGRPVKIVDLARKLIVHSGRRDVKIKFTGLRQGEKLYEEVLIKGEEELPTDNPKIRVAKVLSNDYEVVCQQIDQLATVSRTYDDMKVVKMMKLMVPEFKSNNSKYEIIDKELKR